MVVFSISDVEEGKKLLHGGLRRWIDLHKTEIRKWLDDNVSYDDREDFMNYLFKCDDNNPILLAVHLIIRQKNQSNEEKILKMVEMLNNYKGLLWIIVGKRHSGKTALMHRIAELYKRLYNGKVYWFGPPAVLPDYINGHTLDQNEIPPGSLVLIDEASILFFSRLSYEQNDYKGNFIMQLPVIRHGDKNYIFCTQSSAITDLNIIRLCDAIIFKTRSVLQAQNERFNVSEQLSFFMPQKINEALFYSNEELFIFNYNLPKWWKEEYSKPYAPFKNVSELYRFIIELLKYNITTKRIIELVGIRGYNASELEIETIKMYANFFGIDKLLSLDDKMLKFVIEKGFDDTDILNMYKGNQKYIKANFQLPPIDNDEDMRLKASNLQYALMTKRNINQLFISHCLFRFNHNANIIVSIIGQTGTGKSYAALSLAEFFSELLNSNFDIKNLDYDINSILKRINEFKKDNTVIMDEQTEEFGAGSGSLRMELKNFEETMRKRRINFIYCSPSLRTHTHQFVLKTYGIDYELKLSRLLVYKNYLTGNEIPLGYITLALPSKHLIDEYEKKKDEFLDMVQKRETHIQKVKEKIAEELIKDKKYLSLKNKSQKMAYIRMLPACANLPISAVEEIVSLAEIKKVI